MCAAGYTAFGEAWAGAPVPLRLRGQAQFRAARLYLSDRALQRRKRTRAHWLLTHVTVRAHTHTLHTLGRQAT